MGDIGSLMKSDVAAIGTYKEFFMDDNEGYDIRDGDKICCAAIGRLTWSGIKVIVNAFECFQKLITKHHKV